LIQVKVFTTIKSRKRGEKMKVENQGSNSYQQSMTTNALGKEDFLKVLVTQMKYQDPLSPTNDTEFIAQMAQFSTLEQTVNLNENFQLLSYMLGSGFDSANAFTMIGKNVEIETSTGIIQGIVEKVTKKDGEFMVEVDSVFYPISQVSTVSMVKEGSESDTTVEDPGYNGGGSNG